MKLHQLQRNPSMAIMKKELHSKASLYNSWGFSELKQCNRNFMKDLLDRRWALVSPDTKIHQISLSELEVQLGGVPSIRFSFSNNTQPTLGDDMMKKRHDPSFYVVRDDLLHPLVNGNKARKLDGLLPLVGDHSVTDVVTCGGCQSAHTAAVAVSCAERGVRSHLLLRGEQPDIPTGYNLISTLYGNVIYVPRSLYAKREEMLTRHAELVAGSNGCVILFNDILNMSFATKSSEEANCTPIDAHTNATTMPRAENHLRKVLIVNEGAGDAAALLGVIRLVEYLSQAHLFGKNQPIKIVVDSGTGTTAVGLGLGALCLGLPWEVNAVMLADTVEGYKRKEKHLISEFKRLNGLRDAEDELNGVDDGIVNWVERIHPRKFGNILKGEVESCQQIARQTGILVDPIYTLSAWEHATYLSQKEFKVDTKVVMLHTGGTLGMFGLAQRYKSLFHTHEGTMPLSLE